MRTSFLVSLAAFAATASPAAAGYAFTTLNPPVSSADFPNSYAYAINNSGTVAVDVASSNLVSTQSFLLSGGTYTQVIVPGSAPDSTVIFALNNTGGFGGAYTTAGSFTGPGFIYTGGQYTAIDPTGGKSFGGSVAGINDNGEAVGSALTSTFPLGYVGFSYLNGQYTTIADPNAPTLTFPDGVNNAGDIVGTFTDSNNVQHGFFLHNGQYTTIDVPGAGSGPNQGTSAFNISNTGEIIGGYTGADGLSHGFVDQNGVFTTVDDPFGVGGTVLYGVNDLGQLAGAYTDASGTQFAFVATPVAVPGPGSLTLLSAASLTLAARRLRRG
jgi:probable HAF family extracellular repeat protein